MNRDCPVLFRDKADCCGCAACCSICPQDAITMYTDDEGFSYPRIKEDRCVGCRLCIKVCPFKQNEKRPDGTGSK